MMTLFQQPRPGDWQSVFERVASQLSQLVRAKKESSVAVDFTTTGGLRSA
jgi:hypothetical protein